jgi:lambda repressor-like predicted transcriptional regulator
LAEIKRRFGSLDAFAKTTPLPAGHFSVALQRPYLKAERLIGKALNVPLHQLWPDRYDAKGHRKPLSSSPRTAKASPEADEGRRGGENRRFAAEDRPNRVAGFDSEGRS